MPQSSSAITLTYDVSPHPLSYQTLFAMLLVNFTCKRATPPANTVSGWIKKLTSSVDRNSAEVRQSNFKCAFSRQLELNGPTHASTQVIASVSCALMSDAQAYFGVLWATQYGMYFRTNSTLNIPPLTSEDEEESCEAEEQWDDEDASLKAVLPFADIVSFLPSVALATTDDKVPFICGIPSPIVTPNALQVFTVSPPQIYQFVWLRKVSVACVPAAAPPGLSFVSRQERDAIRALPRGLDAVTFSALAERLWEARRAELKLPLMREGVRYAEAH